MAEKRLYTIPLRDAWNVSIKKRSKRAMAVIRAFTEKHMKTESVKIGLDLNHMIWSRGIKNPPRKVKVQMVPHKKEKDDIETIWVDLATSSMDYLKEKKEKKKEKPKAEEVTEAKPEAGKKPEEKAEKGQEKKAGKKPETKTGEKKAEPKAPEAKKDKAEPVKEKSAEKDTAKETPKPAKEQKAEKPKTKKPEAKPEPAKK